MHFWIDKRASQLQYGRRRPGTFYSGRPCGLGRDKNINNSANQSASSGGSSSGAHAGSSNFRNCTSAQTQRIVTAELRRDPVQSSCRYGRTGSVGNLRGTGSRSQFCGNAHPTSNFSTRAREVDNSVPGELGNRVERGRARRQSAGLRRAHSEETSHDNQVNSQDFTQDLSSQSPSEIIDPKWSRTKRIGLTLCFMAFILLGTVAAKLIIEGPSLIDAARGRHEATPYYFLITELVFIVFAMALFFTGVACLRKRTNDYLLRQFQQHILQASAVHGGTTTIPDQQGDSLPPNDFESQHRHPHHHPAEPVPHGYPGSSFFDYGNNYDDQPPRVPSYAFQTSQGSSVHCQLHHHLVCQGGTPPLLAGTHTCTHSVQAIPSQLGSFQQRTAPMTDLSASSNLQRPLVSSNRRHLHGHRHLSEQQLPPPYHIAVYLPLPRQEIDDTNEIKAANGEGTDDAWIKDDNNLNDVTNAQTHSPAILRGLNSESALDEPQSGRENSETPPPSYEEFAFYRI